VTKKAQGYKPYGNTRVEVAVTQHRDITGLFAKYGVERWTFATDKVEGFATVRFEMEPGRWVRVTLRVRADEGAKEKELEQGQRIVWRALYNWLKTQFEAIEYGVFSPREAFLSWIELPTPQGTITVAEALLPRLEEMPRLLTGGMGRGD